MYVITTFCAPVRWLRQRRGLSQSRLANNSGLSRSAIVALEARSPVATCSTLGAAAQALDRHVELCFPADSTSSDCSTVAIAYKIHRDGERSWQIHLMDLVDELRRSGDARLISLPPPSFIETKLLALLASTVVALCEELQMDVPRWALRNFFLDTPWFVSETEALKATAMAESPLCFRRNNIFVLENFLARA